MRVVAAITLMVYLAVPVNGQELTLFLPDTTLRAASTGEVISLIASRLARDGSRGRLGAVYRLGSVAPSGEAEEKLALAFSREMAEVPPPDTLLVMNRAGQALPALAPFLRLADPPQGHFLYSADRPGWRVQRKSYFRHKDGYGVRYDLEDAARRTIQALAAYDRQAGGPPRLVGEVTLDLPNLLGTLRYLRIHWRRLSPATQTMDLAYAEPRLPLLPLGAQVSFYQDLQDTLYLQRDVKVQITSLPGQPWRTAVGVGWRRLVVTPQGAAVGMVAYRLQNVNLSFRRQTLNHPVNPSRGFRFSLALEGGSAVGAGLGSGSALGKGEVLLEAVKGFSRLALAQELLAKGVAALGFAPQLADFSRFGGSATLRGYREDRFLVPWGVVSRTELRYTTGGDSRVHLFLDLGVLSGMESAAAGGIGMVLRAGRNVVQLDMAWNRNDTLRGGKLHLRLVNLLSI